MITVLTGPTRVQSIHDAGKTWFTRLTKEFP